MSDDFVQRGKLLLARREFAEVVRVCRAGLLNRPALVDGRLLLGTALLALRRYDEVLAEMGLAAEIDRDHVLIHVLRGEALLRKGEAEEAIESLSTAVQLDPNNKVARKLYREARHKAGLDAMPGAPPSETGPATVPEPEPEPPAPAPVAEEASAPAPAPRRRRRLWIGLAAAVVLLLGAAAATVILIQRSRSQSEKLAAMRAEAEHALAPETYAAFVRAARLYGRAAAAGDAPSRAALARVHAAAAFELGVRLQAEAGEPPPAEGHAALIDAVYQALAAGQVADALRQAASLEEADPGDARAAYLAGRARLMSGDIPAAEKSLARAVDLEPRPLSLAALGQAKVAAGHTDEAIKAFDTALALAPDHPVAVAGRARVLAVAGRLPAADDVQAPDRALARLASVEAATPHGDEPPLVSPAQQKEAALALAEVKLARGDAAAVRAVVAGHAEEPADLRFGEVLVAALLSAGDVAGARAEVEKWRAAVPAAGAPRAWQARVALAEDNLEAARTALAEVGDAAETFPALVARGELDLLAGNLEGATAALDKALALRAGDLGALALRARLDLEQGDAAAAEARLTPAYEARKDPALAAVLGEALRRRGARGRARGLLEEASLRLEASSGRPSTLAAVAQSLARLHLEEGRYADAEHEIERALTLRVEDIPARLLAAQIHFDVGDTARARADVDTLAVAAHGSAEVLLLAAQIHTAAGDLDEARQLLDEAARLPTAPAESLTRERARAALAGGHVREAAELLSPGGTLPEDGEACLLLVQARLAQDKRGMAAAGSLVAEVARRYPGKPEEQLARAFLQLARGETADAAASFAAGAQRLEAVPAPPRQIADARLLAGEAYEAASRPDDALTAYREALRVAPASVAAALRLARALVAKGEAAEALETLTQAVKNDPGNADAQLALGEQAAAAKQTALARAALEAYLKLAPGGASADKARRLLQSL